MKKSILTILIVLTGLMFVKAQTIDTNFKKATACKIQPIKARFFDTVNVTHLAVSINGDDLKSRCILTWKLMDDRGVIYLNGTSVISGANYQTWSGNNLYPFTFIGSQLKLNFINN